MIRITRHIPAFVDREEPPERAEVASLGELLALPWVKSGDDIMAKDGKFYRIPFHRFSVSRDGTRRLLMVEHDGGRRWWVVGYLEGDDVDLPTWEPIRTGPSLIHEVSGEEIAVNRPKSN